MLHSAKCATRRGGFSLGVVIRMGLMWYGTSWLGGFKWPIFVGVDALDGWTGCVSIRPEQQLMLEEGLRLCRWSTDSFYG